MTRHGRAADIVFAVACVAALGLYLFLGSGLTFVRDEISATMVAHIWTFDELMKPWNEHWAFLQKLVWKSLMATVGLRSYMPYVLVDLVLHVVIAAAIYVYARRQTYVLIALVVGLLFLFLGSGSESFYLAFQMGWTGAGAAGTWALVLLLRDPRPRHPRAASVLLVVAVATFGGIGLIFLAAATAVVVMSPARRRLWWVVAPAIVTYGIWYLAFGTDAVRTIPDPAAVTAFMRDGIANAFGHVTGLREDVGLVLAVLLGVAAVANLTGSGRVRLGLVAGAAGLATQWALTAVARAGIAPTSFIAERYVHISAILILIGFIGWIGHRRLVAREEPGRLVLGTLAVGGLALAWNLASIVWFHGHWDARADRFRSAHAVLTTYGGTPAIPADHGLANEGRPMALAAPGERRFIPSRLELERVVERFGSPLDDPLALRSTAIPPPVFDETFAEAVAGAVRVAPGPPADAPRPFDVSGSVDVELGLLGSCRTVRATGPTPSVDLVLPSGGTLVVDREGTTGPAELRLSIHGTYRAAGHALEPSDAPLRVELPDVGADVALRARFLPPDSGTTGLCLAGADEP